jgi:hypothetical protein
LTRTIMTRNNPTMPNQSPEPTLINREQAAAVAIHAARRRWFNLGSLGGSACMKKWMFAGISIPSPNYKLEISGLRVWQHKWVPCDGELADVSDTVVAASNTPAQIYKIVADGRQVTFAARETFKSQEEGQIFVGEIGFPSGIYAFYIPAT